LNTIEENFKNTLESNTINFEKMRMLWRVVEEFKFFQSQAYSFPVVLTIRSALKDMKPLTEEQLFEKSTQVEPRQTSN